LKVQPDMVKGYVFGRVYTDALAEEYKGLEFLLIVNDRLRRKPIHLFG